MVVERETIELAFLAAAQVLPPRQRATTRQHADGGIVEITTFGAGLFPAFDLPAVLESEHKP